MNTYPQVPLGEICTVNPGRPRKQGPARSDGEMVVSFVPMSAVDERFGTIAVREERPLSEVSKGYTAFENGDVLFAKITPCMENGKIAVARSLVNGTGRGSTEFFVLRPGERILGEYLYHFVRQSRFREAARRNFTGTAGQQRVPRSFMEHALVALPPLSEQREIVRVLNRAARIERLRAEAVNRLREFIPALFIKMFGDPITNTLGWEVGMLGDVCISAQYGTSKKASDHTGGIPVLRMGNVTYDGYLDCEDMKYAEFSNSEIEKYTLQPGDILFNRTNSKDLVGKTGIWDGRFEAVSASYFIRLRVKETVVAPVYVWALMNSSAMKRRLFNTARGAIGQANINAKEVKSLPLPVPPIALQRRYAEIVETAQAASTLAESGAGVVSALTASLMFRLLGDHA